MSIESVKNSITESLMGGIAEAHSGKSRKTRSTLAIWARRLRYYMFSHQKNIYDEYTIKFLQSLFILMQTMLVFIWSTKV